ncbi:MAG: isochorismate hydrolase [Halobacteriales archaeon]|jgi:isochorismate hydrolase
MSETYADDPAGLANKASDWIESLPYNRAWNRPIDPGETALLVVDMQRYFLDPTAPAFVPTGRTIIEPINDLIGVVEEHGGTVLYTRHLGNEQGVMEEWWGGAITDDTWTELVPELDVQGPVVTKSTYSAFYETGLEDELTGISNLIITGVMTDVCVATAARNAFVRGFRPFVVADGTATTTEAAHVATLRALSHGVAEVTECKRIKRTLR